MSLKEQLTADMKDAMKKHEKDRLAVIRMVRGAVRQAEIDGKKDLNDEDVLTVIAKQVKMRRESLEEFKKGNRADLVEKTQAEINVLLPYMPAQLSEEEVRKLAKEAIEKIGATSPRDIGKVMGALMPQIKGKADGGMANRLVRTLLSQEA